MAPSISQPTRSTPSKIRDRNTNPIVNTKVKDADKLHATPQPASSVAMQRYSSVTNSKTQQVPGQLPYIMERWLAAEDDPWNAGRQNDDLPEDTHNSHDETATVNDSNFWISQVDEHIIQMGAWMDTMTIQPKK